VRKHSVSGFLGTIHQTHQYRKPKIKQKKKNHQVLKICILMVLYTNNCSNIF